MGTWPETISLITNGDPVNDQTINRVILQLAARTQYLRSQLDAASIGEGLTSYSAALASDVVAGDVVYYDSGTDTFKKAIAAAADADAGQLRTANTAYVAGIVIRKTGTLLGDVGLAGRFAGVELTDASDAALASGHYFLSGTTAGKLVSTRPAVGVYVCQVTSDAVIINPTPHEVLEDHVHYRFGISVEAAGTLICTGSGLVRIGYAEDRLGWLPADHSVFGGAAPQGAFFGYNLWQDPELSAIWPPEPLQSVYVELDGVGVASDFLRIDANGIWWMTNCETEVPFAPDTCTSSSAAIVPASSSSSAEAATRAPCDPATRRMLLWCTKMTAKTNLATVTGIQAADGSPIVVSSCATPDASGYCQGRVELDLNMPWDRVTGVTGSEVIKSLSDQGQAAVGHVVEGIRGTGLASVTGTQTVLGSYAAGAVTLTVLDPTSITRTLDVLLVALDGAADRKYAEIVPYIGLVPDRANSFTAKVRIPTLSMSNPRIQLSLDFAMPITGTPPSGITIKYAKITASDVVGESSSSLSGGGGFDSLPTTWSAATNLSLEDLGALTQGNKFRRNVYDLAVASEEVFLFQLLRAGTGGYNGDLAVINMFATVYEG